MSAETITCPRCGMTSAHPMDVKEGYCGACHSWTGAECRFGPEMFATRDEPCWFCAWPAYEHPHDGVKAAPAPLAALISLPERSDRDG